MSATNHIRTTTREPNKGRTKVLVLWLYSSMDASLRVSTSGQLSALISPHMSVTHLKLTKASGTRAVLPVKPTFSTTFLASFAKSVFFALPRVE